MGKKKPADTKQIRSRIREFFPEFKTADLKPHPLNWRLHPEQQKTILSGLIGQFGKIDAILAYESERYGGHVIIDGHQRQEMDETYPVMLLDVTDDEAAKILATYNPVAELATQDTEAYRAIIAQMSADDLREQQEIAKIAQAVLGEQVTRDESESVLLKRVEVKAPPERIWVVIGVPVNNFGIVNAVIEDLRSVPEVIVESTPSDWIPNKDSK